MVRISDEEERELAEMYIELGCNVPRLVEIYEQRTGRSVSKYLAIKVIKNHGIEIDVLRGRYTLEELGRMIELHEECSANAAEAARRFNEGHHLGVRVNFVRSVWERSGLAPGKHGGARYATKKKGYSPIIRKKTAGDRIRKGIVHRLI